MPRHLLLGIPLLGSCVRGGFRLEAPGPRGDAASDDLTKVRLDLRPGETAPCLAGGCEECQPLQNPSCTTPCTANSDCDDLPELDDPWPAACNPVVFSDSFSDAGLSSWLIDHANAQQKISVPACGRLRFLVPAHTTRWIWAKPTVFPPAGLKSGYLVEVRFTAPAEAWVVELFADALELSEYTIPAQRYRKCVLTAALTSPTVLSNQVLTSAGEKSVQSVVAIEKGAGVRLQSWLQAGKAYCQATSGTARTSNNVDAATLTPAPGLLLDAANPAADPPDLVIDFDWIRVFNHD